MCISLVGHQLNLILLLPFFHHPKCTSTGLFFQELYSCKYIGYCISLVISNTPPVFIENIRESGLDVTLSPTHLRLHFPSPRVVLRDSLKPRTPWCWLNQPSSISTPAAVLTFQLQGGMPTHNSGDSPATGLVKMVSVLNMCRPWLSVSAHILSSGIMEF